MIRIAYIWSLALLAAATSAASFAQEFPGRRVTIVVPSSPGAGQDVTARALAQQLASIWNTTVVVDNKPGAGTRIGTEFVVRSKPDGNTILLAAATVAVNATLVKNMPFDTSKDITLVSLLARVPFVLVVNPTLPVKSVAELIGYAQANPQKLSYGTSGIGTGHHLNAEMLSAATKSQFTAVHYGGSSVAFKALLQGEIQTMFIDLSASLESIKSGNVRALAVNTRKRIGILPDLMTVAEAAVPEFEGQSWLGIFTPGKTSDGIVDRLNRDINTAVQSPELTKLLRSFAFEPAGAETSEELKFFFDNELRRWGAAVTGAGLAGSQ